MFCHSNNNFRIVLRHLRIGPMHEWPYQLPKKVSSIILNREPTVRSCAASLFTRTLPVVFLKKTISMTTLFERSLLSWASE